MAGLGNHWIDKVTKMLEFERNCAAPHARIYYELLCDNPTATLEQLVGCLGLAPEADLIERAFSADHGRGPGDYKIDYTGSINANSIGRGSMLPKSFSPAQLKRIDELLVELDYPSLEAGWRGDLVDLLGLKRVADGRAAHEQDERASRSLISLLCAGVEAVRRDGGAFPHRWPSPSVVRAGGRRWLRSDPTWACWSAPRNPTRRPNRHRPGYAASETCSCA